MTHSDLQFNVESENYVIHTDDGIILQYVKAYW